MSSDPSQPTAPKEPRADAARLPRFRQLPVAGRVRPGTAPAALRARDRAQAGEPMDIRQGQLIAPQVSCSRAGQFVRPARGHGAVGVQSAAGVSVVAQCPDGGRNVAQSVQEAGCRAVEVAFG